MRLTRRDGRGFTLIELMVVIAIIAALAALLLPVIANMVESARARACTANLKSHGTAFLTYKTDNQGKLPCLFMALDVQGKYTLKKLDFTTAKGKADDSMKDVNLGQTIREAIGTNPMQNVWLIIDGGYIGGGEAAYKCPNDKDWIGRKFGSGQETDSKYGWTSTFNFSYGMQFPYAGTKAVEVPGSNPVSYQLNGQSENHPDDTWNWANPNGLVVANSPDSGKAQMYPDNCIYMADRNPREASSDTGDVTDGGWGTTYPGNSNHEEGVCAVEKGGTNAMFPTVNGQVGRGGDDIYTNREAAATTGVGGKGLPYVDKAVATNFDSNGFAKSSCTDTVIWPLSRRGLERSEGN